MPPRIKITEEMLEAGVAVLCKFETLTAGEEYWAKEVYIAMASLSGRALDASTPSLDRDVLSL